MKKLIQLLLIPVVVISCTSSGEEKPNRPNQWLGEWKATWETPAESYPELTDMEFSMNGVFEFSEDSLTVVNNGYKGCVFAIDTLKHTQSWRISNDTLITYNDASTPGMTYKVTSQTEGQIKLQLMDDIFVTLSK